MSYEVRIGGATYTIERSPDGRFIWPGDLPRRLSVGSTVAANVIAYGTGALNIDAGRIEAEGGSPSAQRRQGKPSGTPGDYGDGHGMVSRVTPERYATPRDGEAIGRWPANVALDEEAAAMLDAQSGERQAGAFPAIRRSAKFDGVYQGWDAGTTGARNLTDTGGASRFFYTAKASRSEREAWGRIVGAVDPQRRSDGRESDIENPRLRTSERVNDHPTVKPIELMAWLLRLVTPPGGLVLDPFAGSGTTLVAARRERIRCMGIERDPRSVAIAAARVGAQYEVKLGL